MTLRTLVLALSCFVVSGCSFDLAALRVAQIAPSSDAPATDATFVDASGFTDAGVYVFADAGAPEMPDAALTEADAFQVVPDAFTGAPDAPSRPSDAAGPVQDGGGFRETCTQFGLYRDCDGGGRQLCDSVRWSICT